ncbi:YqiJ family protein [Devosia oryziradicis]|uniref:YqiJ family protein n=1 Tax=Devosia oryziradicis TaxID=2801335 RepID=A0ABX7BU40_9HYPH|nr:YqiJ family protein [Devosia oryziradicis]QQR35460.1 YqiJ family protein [Devosia oryziradicis]
MDVFASETAPFAVAIGVTLAIAAIELLGLLLGTQPSAMVDSALPDLDTDIPDVELGPLSQSLSWLSFGRLPALVVLILLTASFGLCGFALQEALRQVLGFALDPWLASIPAAIGAVFVTRHVGLAIARIMPKEETEAVSTKAFVGRVATVFRGVAGPGAPAEAKLTDIHGKTHYLLIEPEDGETVMPEGSEVVIIRQQGSVYRAISKLKPAN